VNRSASVLNAISTDGKSETPFYGLRAFARDLDAERRRLDQIALQAALETLQAEEAGQ
jgi:hypothetical protein